MVVVEFKSKKDKEHLLEKARKMEEYASMIVDCIEESKAREEEDDEYNERNYRNYRHPEYDDEYDERRSRYSYRRMR